MSTVTVLVVERTPTRFFALERALTKARFFVVHAINVPQAAGLMRHHHRYAAVILDTDLPRCDHPALIAAWRAAGYRGFVLVTADAPLPADAPPVDATYWMNKPYTLPQLITTLKAGLALPATSLTINTE